MILVRNKIKMFENRKYFSFDVDILTVCNRNLSDVHFIIYTIRYIYIYVFAS